MRSWVWAPLVVSLVACGGDPPTTEAEQAPSTPLRGDTTNLPPVIAEVQLSPVRPRPGDRLAVRATVNDPEGDAVDLSYDWYIDRRLYHEDGPSHLDTSDLQRGVEVYVNVRATDGSSESALQTAAVRIENSPPRVTAIRLFPDVATADASLMVEAQVEDREGDDYRVEYEWFVNGEPLPGATGPTLEPGRVKRGDAIAVRAVASDRDEGQAYVSPSFSVANSDPEITSTPSTRLASENRYRYAIQAKDPDGDRPLRYALIDGPSGMTVDFLEGVVEWDVPPDADGTFPIEVEVSDAFGGRTRQQYVLEFHWESVPANADAPSGEGDAEEEDDDEDEADDDEIE